MPGRRRSLLAAAAAATLLAGVGTPAASALARVTAAGDAPATAQDANPRPHDKPVATVFPDPTNPTGCDTTQPDARTGGSDGSSCMMPWPNDLFTRGTGADRRLNLPLAGMPKDAAGKPINPLPYDVSDGFSPGQRLVIHIPGLDNRAAFALTKSVPITDMGAYLSPTAPVVVIDVQTGKRWPIWTEIDTNPLGPVPTAVSAGGEAGTPTGPDRPFNTMNVSFVITPAKNFINGHRYVVGLRHLKDSTGAVIPAPLGFSILRDESPIPADAPDQVKALESRRAHFEQDIFPVLTEAGFARSSLYQAWDFSVASAKNIAGRLLSIRNDAFRQLGDTTMADRKVEGDAPTFTVDTVTPTTHSDGTPDLDANVRETIQGTFKVPCYINTPNCAPGGTFAFAPTDVDQTTPLQIPGNMTTAKYTCKVPKRVFMSAKLEKVRPSLYGHGLFGGQSEVGQGQVSDMVQEHNFMYCATDWEGMATIDITAAGQADADMDRFPALTDHVQQGVLNFMYLARLMIHPQGFSANPAFQIDKGDGPQSFIDTTRAWYDGNSQGGIYGGTYLAVAPDTDAGVLGVPGINYSVLLRRSKDFALYSIPLYTTYPSEFERPLLLSVIQILWDRSDPNGYVNQLNPAAEQKLEETPAHRVLYEVSFGDHQVANVTAETAARSAGAAVDPHPLVPGRSPDVVPAWGIPRIQSYPYAGSGFVYFDSGDESVEGGTPAAPAEDTPPRAGQDPHEFARRTPCGRVMKANFLRVDGVVTNPCLGAPYFSNNNKPTANGQGWQVQPGDAFAYPDPIGGPTPAVPEAPYAVLLLLAAAGTVGLVLRGRHSQLRSSQSSG